MATLSGQTIQSTYQGLLKLANSTTGITNSVQSIEDGLGNNTGINIKSNFLNASNQIPIGTFKNKYFGVGIDNAADAITSGNQNCINTRAFYIPEYYSFSAISIANGVNATTEDLFEAAFYTAEMGSNGLYPKDVIISGITAQTTSGATALKTYVFPTPITFSATPGMNFFVTKITTTAATRTANFWLSRIEFTNGRSNALVQAYGFNLGANSTVYNGYMGKNVDGFACFTGLTTFNQSYTESDFNSPSTTRGLRIGFVLHTVDG